MQRGVRVGVLRAFLFTPLVALPTHTKAGVQSEPPAPHSRVPTLDRSSDGPRIAVSLEAGEDTPPAVFELWSQRLQEGFSRASIAIVLLPNSGECRADVLACAAERADVDLVVRAIVTQRDRDYALRFELHSLRDRAPLADADKECSICGAAEVGDMIDAQVATLGPTIAHHRAPGHLAIDTDPAGAALFLDDKPAGKTPAEHPLPPGTHTLRLEHPGYETHTRTIEISRGAREHVHATLRRAEKIRTGRGLRVTGWTTLGLGIGGAAGAALPLWLLHGRDVESRCTGENIDFMGRCRYQYSTRAGAIGAAAASGVAIVVGAALAGVGHKRGRLHRETARRAWVVPTGDGIAVRF